jgi:hypothetical protein
MGVVGVRQKIKIHKISYIQLFSVSESYVSVADGKPVVLETAQTSSNIQQVNNSISKNFVSEKIVFSDKIKKVEKEENKTDNSEEEPKNSHPFSNETHVNVIVHTSNADRINFANENLNLRNSESSEINGKNSNFELNSSANQVNYLNLESYPNPNYHQSEYQTPLYSESETYNWPFDLSRNGVARQRASDINRSTFEESNYALSHPTTPLIADPNYGGRNYLQNYLNNANMKGNCVTMCPTNYSPSPVNSSNHDYHLTLDEFDHYDDNNNQTFHYHNNNHITTLQDVLGERFSFKDEYINPLVEDAPENTGSYITLTSAASGPHPHDLHMLRDYNNHQLHHSTSSGDSRSPTGFSHDEFDSNINFTQLNSARSSNIMYASMPVGSNEQNLIHPPAYETLGHAR